MSRWPWAVAMLAIALIPLMLVANQFQAESPTEVIATLLISAGIVSLTLTGALLATRVPRNPIGYLLLAAGVLIIGSTVASAYAAATTAAGAPWPGTEVAQVLEETLFIYGIVIAIVMVPLVFPTGRLLSPRWRWAVWVLVAGMAAITLSAALGSETSMTEGARVRIGSDADLDVTVLLEAINAFSALFGLAAAAAATIIRFRRSRGAERQQMKWLVAVATVAAVTLPPALVVPIPIVSNVLLLVTLASVAFLPIAIGIAVLRYRLYEIDRLISRTIGWALVTGLLVGAFALLVLALSTVLAPLTAGNTLAVAGSTLVVVSLFAPLRARVQRTVDRRFDRSRYDGERTLEAFGARLRDEVDLEVIRNDVLTTVGSSVRPTRVGLWLRTPGGEPGHPDAVTISGRAEESMPS